MTMLEVVIAIAVLLISVMATLGAIASFVMLGETTRETKVAYLEAQAAIERMRVVNFTQAFALFNEDPNDDPGGVGTAPGANFAVARLTTRDGDPDGLVGRIVMPADPGAPGVLREDLADPELGMPMDLSSDGVADALDHSGDYTALPIRVLVEWRSKSGNSVVEFQTMLVR